MLGWGICWDLNWNRWECSSVICKTHFPPNWKQCILLIAFLSSTWCWLWLSRLCRATSFKRFKSKSKVFSTKVWQFQMHLHHGSNYEAFHKDFVPTSSLPSDLGGDLSSAEEMHKQHNQEFARMRNYFLADEKETRIIKK